MITNLDGVKTHNGTSTYLIKIKHYNTQSIQYLFWEKCYVLNNKLTVIVFSVVVVVLFFFVKSRINC